MCPAEQAGGRLLEQPISFVPDPKRLRLAERLALSKLTFPELLFGALRVADVSGGLLVRPALQKQFNPLSTRKDAKRPSLGILSVPRRARVDVPSEPPAGVADCNAAPSWTCAGASLGYTSAMSFEQLKREVASLSSQEQAELISYALHLRYAGDLDYRREVTERLNDSDKSHWLTPEEFERRLDNA